MPWKFFTALAQEKQTDGTPNDTEGVSDFSATAGTYSIPNGSFGTPGWYAPLIVGPNQVWECVGTAAVQCVTAVHGVVARMGVRDNAGAAVSGAVYSQARNTVVVIYPPVINTNVTPVVHMRLITDGTVPANTTIRLVQEFQGAGANGRVARDGTYYQSWAWRRI